MHLRIIARFGSIQIHLLKLGKLALQKRSAKTNEELAQKKNVKFLSFQKKILSFRFSAIITNVWPSFL